MRKLVWFLVVLVVLAVVVDRGADYAAERIVADNLATSEKLAEDPDVDIAGFPFLTQFAAGRYDEVRAVARDVEVGEGDRAVSLARVAFTFRDVTTNRDFTRFTAETGAASARISYPELSDVVGLGVSYAGDGKVEATKKIEIAGEELSPSITVEPEVLDGALSFTNTALAGDVPEVAAQVLREAFQLDVPLDGLPFDVTVDSLEATERGIVLRLSGRDLTYRTP